MSLRKILGPYQGLPNAIYLLALANAVNNLGFFIWPLMSLLLTDRLGFSKTQAGLFVTIMIAASAPASLLGGRLADRLGRRNIFLIMRTLGALFLVPCAFLGNARAVPWLLFAGSIISAFSWPCLNAMVADLTDNSQRSSAYSLMYLGLNIGVAIGPMIAGFLYNSHLPWLYLGDAFTTILSSILVALKVPETLPAKEDREAASGAEAAERGGLVTALLRRPQLLGVSLSLLVLSIVYAQFGYGLPLQARATFGTAGPGLYGTLMSLNGLTVILGTAPLTYLTRNLPTALSLGAGAFLYAVGFGMIGLLGGSVALFLLSTLIWSAGEVVLTVNSQVYVANNTPVTHRGRFSSAVWMIADIGHATGPAVMGRLADRRGIGAIWPVCFFLAGPVALLFFAQAGLAARQKSILLQDPQVSLPAGPSLAPGPEKSID